MTAIYEVHDVCKTYKKGAVQANRDLSFTIEPGEVFGLLGPNGAGKTTLVSQLAGLLKPTSGSITLFGKDLVARPEWAAECVALQPQNSLSLWNLQVREAIFYTGRLRGLPTAEAKRQSDALIEEMGLSKVVDRRISRISGGQRKMVTLAVAFMAHRPVMIFDEPTNELDPENRRRVWEMIQRENRERGTTVLLVTHNVLEAERVVQRVGIVSQGRMMALGSTGTLKAQVDRRVRLELLVQPGARQRADEVLPALGEVQAIGGGRYLVLCPRETVRAQIDAVLGQLGLDQLDDFRILTPSLEDVYLQLGGVERLGQETAAD